jgi:hypothetical protein
MLGLRMIDRNAELSEVRRVVGDLVGKIIVAEPFRIVVRRVDVLAGAA